VSFNFRNINHHHVRKPGVVFGTRCVVVFPSGGPVVFGGTNGVVVGPAGGAVVFAGGAVVCGGTKGVVVSSAGGPVVPGPAVVPGFPAVVVSAKQPNSDRISKLLKSADLSNYTNSEFFRPLNPN
jgi:hypothetical protein